jgi:hypothetical protein
VDELAAAIAASRFAAGRGCRRSVLARERDLAASP